MAQSFVGLPGLDAFIQGKINQAVDEERTACLDAVKAERLNQPEGQCDRSYNTAISHAAMAILARSALPVKENSDV
jgi:hypothetical protein